MAAGLEVAPPQRSLAGPATHVNEDVVARRQPVEPFGDSQARATKAASCPAGRGGGGDALLLSLLRVGLDVDCGAEEARGLLLPHEALPYE